MTRSPRLLAAAWLGVAVLGLGACGGDGDGSNGAATSSPSATVSESDEPTADPTPDASETAAPTVAPATGIELREQTSSIQVPEGWRDAPPIASYQSGATGPRGAGTISLMDVETLNPNTPLEERVKAALQTLPDGAKPTRLPDVMLGDSPAYHLMYTKAGRGEVTHIIETERNQRLITIDLYISNEALKQSPDLVESVLATFQWLD